MRVTIFSAVAVAWLIASPAHAQDHGSHAPADADASAWTWAVDGNAFFGYNYQQRKFTDFDEWESQNWLMATASRRLPTGRLRLHSMWSLEPITLRDLGSPQVFQTGETFGGAALVDYQHPHDLVMGLGGDAQLALGRATILLGADLVGSATLGPTPFMHRLSAAENPQAPLSHHHLDATHITPGVLRAGIERSGWRGEVSWFQGREPDEDRTDLDLGALDSVAVRLSWAGGPWSAQISSGWLTQPELVTPYDAIRHTASLSYARGDERRSLAWTAAFGQNREIHGNLEAYLLEATWRLRATDALYTRAEVAAKDILDVGFHPVNTFHPHRQSVVGAVTLGYVRELARTERGSLGVGGDITGYRTPANLRDSYGSPVSYHVFLRYRARLGQTSTGHVH